MQQSLTIPQIEQSEDLETLYRWLRLNRGVLARIARQLRCSHGKVRWTYFGSLKNPDVKVVRLLAIAGAPGFTEPNEIELIELMKKRRRRYRRRKEAA